MKYLFLIAVAASLATPGRAQGVNDPSTPRSVIIVNPPQQPSRPTAVPNIPPRSTALPLGVRRSYRYYGGGRR
jgi:hypothetical protein